MRLSLVVLNLTRPLYPSLPSGRQRLYTTCEMVKFLIDGHLYLTTVSWAKLREAAVEQRVVQLRCANRQKAEIRCDGRINGAKLLHLHLAEPRKYHPSVDWASFDNGHLVSHTADCPVIRTLRCLAIVRVYWASGLPAPLPVVGFAEDSSDSDHTDDEEKKENRPSSGKPNNRRPSGKPNNRPPLNKLAAPRFANSGFQRSGRRLRLPAVERVQVCADTQQQQQHQSQQVRRERVADRAGGSPDGGGSSSSENGDRAERRRDDEDARRQQEPPRPPNRRHPEQNNGGHQQSSNVRSAAMLRAQIEVLQIALRAQHSVVARFLAPGELHASPNAVFLVSPSQLADSELASFYHELRTALQTLVTSNQVLVQDAQAGVLWSPSTVQQQLPQSIDPPHSPAPHRLPAAAASVSSAAADVHQMMQHDDHRQPVIANVHPLSPGQQRQADASSERPNNDEDAAADQQDAADQNDVQIPSQLLTVSRDELLLVYDSFPAPNCCAYPAGRPPASAFPLSIYWGTVNFAVLRENDQTHPNDGHQYVNTRRQPEVFDQRTSAPSFPTIYHRDAFAFFCAYRSQAKRPIAERSTQFTDFVQLLATPFADLNARTRGGLRSTQLVLAWGAARSGVYNFVGELVTTAMSPMQYGGAGGCVFYCFGSDHVRQDQRRLFADIFYARWPHTGSGEAFDARFLWRTPKTLAGLRNDLNTVRKRAEAGIRFSLLVVDNLRSIARQSRPSGDHRSSEDHNQDLFDVVEQLHAMAVELKAQVLLVMDEYQHTASSNSYGGGMHNGRWVPHYYSAFMQLPADRRVLPLHFIWQQSAANENQQIVEVPDRDQLPAPGQTGRVLIGSSDTLRSLELQPDPSGLRFRIGQHGQCIAVTADEQIRQQ